MIGLWIQGHQYQYEIQTTINAFYPLQKIQKVESPISTGITVSSFFYDEKAVGEIYEKGQKKEEYIVERDEEKEVQENSEKKMTRRMVKSSIYYLLKKYTKDHLPWGMLTGIRPTKIVHELMAQGYLIAEIQKIIKRKYDVRDDKIILMVEVAKTERKIIEKNDPDEVSIYIGIPFCPTRCLYCSFTSFPIEQWKGSVDQYLKALEREMEAVSYKLRNRKIRSLYIGGGTPTSIDEEQLEQLMRSVQLNFGLDIDEITVEAGRPDTITFEKMMVLKNHGVHRVSINPQSMNELTLERIGRKHSAQDIVDSFHMAREAGIEQINMDVIIGLPGETIEDVRYTMKKISDLQPDNITVHAMAVKRASLLKIKNDEYSLLTRDEAEEMGRIAKKAAKRLGMEPYYLYRQKNMTGNLENIGYALPGKECIYNIEIMEEKESIIALGAGASTKLVDLSTNRIERIENVKNVEHYIRRIEEMIGRKSKIPY